MDQLHRAVRQHRRGRAPGAPGRRGVLGLLLAAGICAAACARPAAAPSLAHTFESPEGLAQAVVQALEARDGERLQSLALSEAEFRAIVWPELPVSRPERGVPFDFVWSQLHQKSRGYLQQTLAEHGGARYEVVAVRFTGETTDYGSFQVSRRAQLAVRDGAGRERTLRLFGSVLRRDGSWKLFSYVVD